MASGSGPSRVVFSTKAREYLINLCEAAYPNEGGFALFGFRRGDVIRIEDILPFQNCSGTPKSSFRFPRDLATQIGRYEKVKGLTCFGLGHTHPIPTLPSPEDLKLIQVLGGLHIWVLHKPNGHDIRASWDINDIKVEFENEGLWTDEKIVNITTSQGIEIDLKQLPTISRVLNRIHVESGSSASSIKTILGTGKQAKRHLSNLIKIGLVERTPGRKKPKSKPGRPEEAAYRLTEKGTEFLLLCSNFFKQLRDLCSTS